MKVESGIEQERGGEEVEGGGVGGAGAEREKKGDLEKRFAFRKK